jgi:PAS domain S-box-containing protein
MLIFQNSKDLIFCLNQNQTIEIVNSPVSELLGYSPEQLLGQHISSIFLQDQFKDISTQFEMMKIGNCPLFYENHLEIVSHSDTFTPVHAILLGINENGKNEVESFVLILKNETNIQSQMKQSN